MSALDQVIDLDLEDRSSAEIACAYRALCATMLLRTAMAAKAKTPPRKVELDQLRTAMSWVKERQGIISFADACSALDMDLDRARGVILGYAQARGRGTIKNTAPLMSRNVPRRRKDARLSGPPDQSDRQIQAPHGVAAGAPAAADHRHLDAWS